MASMEQVAAAELYFIIISREDSYYKWEKITRNSEDRNLDIHTCIERKGKLEI